jgi:hypothetical protein
MARPITVSINVTKILKQYLHEGKNGKYLNLAIFENRDGPGKYGDTHYVIQDIPKEARDRGEKGPIIGNCKMDAGSPAPVDRNFSRPPAKRETHTRTDDSGGGEVDF